MSRAGQLAVNSYNTRRDEHNANIMSIPSSAKAWVITNTKDGVNALKQETRPVQQPGSKEVLVKMKAASLNYRDLIIPQGLYPFSQSLLF
jgi:hypothetical protein